MELCKRSTQVNSGIDPDRIPAPGKKISFFFQEVFFKPSNHVLCLVFCVVLCVCVCVWTQHGQQSADNFTFDWILLFGPG